METQKTPRGYFLRYLSDNGWLYTIIDQSKALNEVLYLSFIGNSISYKLTEGSIEVGGKKLYYFNNSEDIDKILDGVRKASDWGKDTTGKTWTDFTDDLWEDWEYNCRDLCKHKDCQMPCIGYNCTGLGGKYRSSDSKEGPDWERKEGSSLIPIL